MIRPLICKSATFYVAIMMKSFSFFLLILFLSATPAQAAKGPPAAPVSVAQAETRQLAPIIWVAGTTFSRHDARLAAEISGRLIAVAEVGDSVSRGATVARIDNQPLKLQLAEYRAAIQRVKARRVFLSKDVRWLKRLAKSNNAAQKLLDQTEADLGVSAGDLASSQARLKQLQDRINRSILRAPFAGIVVQRFLQPGEWADSGDQVLRLVDVGSLEARAMVPLVTLPFLRKGMKLRMRAGQTEVLGRLRTFVTAGEDQSHLVDMRIDFDDADWSVGTTLRVAVPTAAPRKVVVVPRDALVLRRSGMTVYRVTSDAKAQPVKVTAGTAQGDVIEVKGGIVAGDRVIVRGGERLFPGQAVHIADGPGGAAQYRWQQRKK